MHFGLAVFACILCSSVSAKKLSLARYPRALKETDYNKTTYSSPFVSPSLKAKLLGIDDTSLFITGTVPSQQSLHATREVGIMPDAVYLVAATKDGGPFANLYVLGPPVKNASLWSTRNFHESFYNGIQCMHWQKSDEYDAEWVHWCGDHDWKEGVFAGPLGSAPKLLQMSQSNFLQKREAEAPGFHPMVLASDMAHMWLKPIYQDYCDGHFVVAQFLSFPDSKGVECLSSSPKLSDACFGKIQQAVRENHIEEWMPSRANVDQERPLEDWPW